MQTLSREITGIRGESTSPQGASVGESTSPDGRSELPLTHGPFNTSRASGRPVRKDLAAGEHADLSARRTSSASISCQGSPTAASP